jgi:hypothetical protein
MPDQRALAFAFPLNATVSKHDGDSGSEYVHLVEVHPKSRARQMGRERLLMQPYRS